MAPKILKREFIGEEGLASMETIYDNPLDWGCASNGEILALVAAGQRSYGAVLVFLNEQNRLVMRVGSREELESLRDLGEAIAALVEAIDETLSVVESSDDEDSGSNVVLFPGGNDNDNNEEAN